LNNDNESIESKFFPLYDKILNYWFPPTEGYDVCPQWAIPDTGSFDDRSINFVIEHHQHPLLLVDIKPLSDFQSRRDGAISRAIVHLDELGPKNLQWAQKPLQCLGVLDWGGCGAWGHGNRA